MASRIDIKDVLGIAKRNGGKCLSKNFVDQFSPLKWMCKKGHTWDIAYFQVSRGFWCIQCAKEEDKKQNALLKKIRLKEKTPRHKSVKNKPLKKWKCNRGHIWKGNRLYQEEHGCIQCRKEDKKTTELKKLQALAIRRGGKCLSTVYINNITKIKWQCANGHAWQAKPVQAKDNETWCAQCKADEAMQEMIQVAAARGGQCLSTTYKGSHTKMKWLCSKGHTWRAHPTHIRTGRWCPVCRYDSVSEKLRGDINEIRKLAIKNGGKLLSKEYINRNEPLQFQCDKGHQWFANASNIIFGKTWCPVCAHRVPITMDEMHELARSNGGKCLSTKYVSGKTKLKWQCQEGHQWKTIPALVKRGTWCPECALERKGDRTRNSIDIYDLIAKKNGGRLLSRTYINANTHMEWKCKKGHSWFTTPAKIKNRGQWCPYCAGKRKLETV